MLMWSSTRKTPFGEDLLAFTHSSLWFLCTTQLPYHRAKKMAEVFLGAFVNVLVDRLASGDLWNFARKEGIDTQLTKWSSMLEQVQAVVADAEEKQITDRETNLWLSDLEDLSYDMDDVLDEFATEALRRKVMKEPRASTSKILDCPNLASFPEQGLPPSLSDLHISGCPELASFPEQGLPPSLSELWISDCPNLALFPEQGLPHSLLRLSINECPILKRRCEKRKGQYWGSIAHIPEVLIDYRFVFDPSS